MLGILFGVKVICWYVDLHGVSVPEAVEHLARRAMKKHEEQWARNKLFAAASASLPKADLL